MDDPDIADGPIDDVPELVDKNGLVELFANRARARILVTLFYANEPVTVAEITNGAGMNRSTVHEALEQLDAFDVLEALDGADEPRYRLRSDDELVEAVRELAELATDRFYGGGE